MGRDNGCDWKYHFGRRQKAAHAIGSTGSAGLGDESQQSKWKGPMKGECVWVQLLLLLNPQLPGRTYEIMNT